MITPLTDAELPEFLGVSTAVEYVPRSKLTITRALRSGALRGSHAGRTSPWVIRRADLLAWVDKGCPAAPQPSDAPIGRAS